MRSGRSLIWRSLGALAGAVLFLCGAESIAQDSTQSWIATGDPAPWNTDENWENLQNAAFSGIPNASFGDAAEVNNGGTAVVDVEVPEVLTLTVNNGTVDIQQGGSLKVVEDLGEFGNTIVGGSGSLILSGNGALETGDLSNNGQIQLSGNNASLATRGAFTQAQGSLAFDISSAGNAVINVGGAAALGGSIAPSFDGVSPAFGDSFEFLSGASSVADQGAQVVLPANVTLDTGLALQLATTNSTASITVGNLPVLSLDRVTGKAAIKNVVGGPLTLDSYTIGSERGLLNPDGWSSLNSQGNSDWVVANPLPQQIAELNFTSSSTLEVGSGLDLGNAYNGGATHPRDEDVTLVFSTPDGRILDGLVEYTGPANDLVLNVDPTSGDATIQHLSSHLGPIDLAGYNIQSPSGALSVEGWNSFVDSNLAGEGWAEANPHPEGLAEVNLTDSHVVDNGTVLPLGSIFTPGSLSDLEFSFSNTAGEFFIGTVEYGGVPGDCNGDGVVNIFDANCTPDGQLDDFLASLNPASLRGDANGDGAVQFEDLVTLSNNFGNPGQYTDADFDKDGVVQFGDLVILSDSFGQTAGGTVASVPEPSGLLGLACGVLLLGMRWNRVGRTRVLRTEVWR